MADTIFTRIINGEIPCHKVFDDAHVLAFLDIFPLSRGHTLVVPKEPAETLDQLSENAAAALGRVLPRICRAVLKVSGATAYNLLQNNRELAHQAVMHVHFHIIPRFDQAEHAGLGLVWRPGKLEAADGAAMARLLATAMR